jgi:hypothetical protein
MLQRIPAKPLMTPKIDNGTMSLQQFLELVRQGGPVRFEDTLAVVAENYRYTPTRFVNGAGEAQIVNEPGTNEGSCRIFNFASIHALTTEQTLSLFGVFYDEVKAHPTLTTHPNIRAFSKFGWDGIRFDGNALIPI